MSSNDRIERSGAGVTSKSLAAMARTNPRFIEFARSPEGRAGLMQSASGRAALAVLETRGGLPKTSTRARTPYGPESSRSFFRDLKRKTDDARHRERMFAEGIRGSGYAIGEIGPNGEGGIEEVNARVDQELRYVTSSAGGGGFTAYGWVGAETDSAARIEGKMTGLVTTEILPPTMTVRLPVQTGAAVAAVTAEGGSVTDTALTSTYQDAPIITLAGQVTTTQQVLDRADGEFDKWMARELGADLARVIDRQIIFGSGSGELTGLLTLSGTTATTYTDASPTVAEARPKIWTMARDVEVASGLEIDTLIMHPTRAAWLQSGTDANSRSMLGVDLPARPVTVASIPTTRGSGANEDRIIGFRRDRVILHTSPIRFRIVDDHADGGNLAVRIQAYLHCALVVTRPSAVGYLAGTGLVLPTI